MMVTRKLNTRKIIYLKDFERQKICFDKFLFIRWKNRFKIWNLVTNISKNRNFFFLVFEQFRVKTIFFDTPTKINQNCTFKSLLKTSVYILSQLVQFFHRVENWKRYWNLCKRQASKLWVLFLICETPIIFLFSLEIYNALASYE